MTTSTLTGKAPLRCMLFSLLLAAPLVMANDGQDLTFEGDGTFNGPHGGQEVHAAVVDVDSGDVVATESGTVSADEAPAFSFDFPGVLKEGGSYEVHYWIDSNFGGGREGACDPKGTDHQWSVSLEATSEALTHEDTHRPAEQADVCATFE
ncbi:hypothetical protein [Halomonas icarae]|uniref:DUF4198 domain-containing protein n=1 Tax=Halomonas icarae TaxID=2691040 RepID=A0A7X5AL80_9GAMM|nr:hypothetical protein [Halomonas icarae]MDR5901779.1 hypothetical protein [Halomonas icarae]NAW13127.1 hypothetical protein [Halomonas icarae]